MYPYRRFWPKAPVHQWSRIADIDQRPPFFGWPVSGVFAQCVLTARSDGRRCCFGRPLFGQCRCWLQASLAAGMDSLPVIDPKLRPSGSFSYRRIHTPDPELPFASITRSGCRRTSRWVVIDMRERSAQTRSPAMNAQGFTGLPLAVASFRHVTVTHAGLSLPASE
jgi:hypothetical protein